MAWTEEKRRSVQRYGGGGVLPVADGTIDAGDRAHVVGLFAADSFPAPSTPAAPTYAAQATSRRITNPTQSTRLFWTRWALPQLRFA